MNSFEDARQRLVDALNEEHNPSYWGGEPRDAERLVNDFAHALAERIRIEADEHAEGHYGMHMAADLIDPEGAP